MSNQVNVDELLKQAEKINTAIAKHNNENQRHEGYREATKKRVLDELKKFNEEFGTALTLEDPNTFRDEYVNVVKAIFTETKHAQEVLVAIDANDIKKVSALTGLNIEQETIKMPRIDIDMDEMEKQADQAFAEIINNANQLNEMGVSGEEEDAESMLDHYLSGGDETADGIPSNLEVLNIPDDSIEEEDLEEEEFDEEDDVPSIAPNASQSNIRNMFDAKMDKSQPKQTEQPSMPNFSGMFGNVNKETTQAQKPETSKPDFSSMFKTADAPKQTEEKKEDNSISNFLQGFNTTKAEPKKEENKKVEDALKGQGAKMPTFNFGSIDVDED